MPTLNIDISITGLGGSVVKRGLQRTQDSGGIREIALPAGKTGSLSTRTDNETGVLTMSGGHGITTSARIDLYWDGGARYGINVGTVSGNTVPIGPDNSGTGDNLPAEATPVVATVRVEFEIDIVASELSVLSLQTLRDSDPSADSHIDFYDDGDGLLGGVAINADEVSHFDVEGGATSPISGGTTVLAQASNGSSSAAGTLTILFLQDST